MFSRIIWIVNGQREINACEFWWNRDNLSVPQTNIFLLAVTRTSYSWSRIIQPEHPNMSLRPIYCITIFMSRWASIIQTIEINSNEVLHWYNVINLIIVHSFTVYSSKTDVCYLYNKSYKSLLFDLFFILSIAIKWITYWDGNSNFVAISANLSPDKWRGQYNYRSRITPSVYTQDEIHGSWWDHFRRCVMQKSA